jgi:hypothetical protein
MKIIIKLIKELLIIFVVFFGIGSLIVGGIGIKVYYDHERDTEIQNLLHKYKESRFRDKEIYKKLSSFDKKYFTDDELELLKCRNDYMKYIRYQLNEGEYSLAAKNDQKEVRWDIALGNFIEKVIDYGSWLLWFLFAVMVFNGFRPASSSSITKQSTTPPPRPDTKVVQRQESGRKKGSEQQRKKMEYHQEKVENENSNTTVETAKYHVVEKGSSLTWTSFSSLEEAKEAIRNKANPYYIYKQNKFSTESYGVWHNGSKISEQKNW